MMKNDACELQPMPCLLSARGVSLLELVGIRLKEVAFEDVADAQKQLGVNARPIEDFVDVSAIAVEFTSEPND